MKKCVLILMTLFFLVGCSQPDYETLGEVSHDRHLSQPKQVSVRLPGDAAQSLLTNAQSEKLYVLEDYAVTVMTLEAGDLNRTLQTATGFSLDDLQLMEHERNGVTQYDCVWTSAGEGEDQVGRLRILDDGDYHYVVCTMAPASVSGELTDTWAELFGSVSLVEQ